MPLSSVELRRLKRFSPVLVRTIRLPFGQRRMYNALLTVLKKIDFDLSMLRVASRRHIFEAHVNGFTLVLQVHGAKPFDDLAQQASVRLG